MLVGMTVYSGMFDFGFSIDIIPNNGLEMRIQINTIIVCKKLWLTTAGVYHLLVSCKGMFVTYSWINYHLH